MASTTSPRWASAPIGVGTLLTDARTQASLSRSCLAAALHVSVGQLRDVEDGRRPPSAELAERLCAALPLDDWHKVVLTACAVDTGTLRTRRGTRHVHGRGAPLPDAVRERVATERARGRSWQAIAAGLNQDRVPTVQGRRWWASSVSRLGAAVSAGG